jgi:hypothetical protein
MNVETYIKLLELTDRGVFSETPEIEDVILRVVFEFENGNAGKGSLRHELKNQRKQIVELKKEKESLLLRQRDLFERIEKSERIVCAFLSWNSLRGGTTKDNCFYALKQMAEKYDDKYKVRR